MALIVYTGFDYDPPNSAQWSSLTLVGRTTSPVRTGSHSCDVGVGALGHALSNLATVVCGAAFYPTDTPATSPRVLIRLRDGSTEQLSVTVEADNSIAVRRGDYSGTSVAQSSPCKLPPGAWSFLEFKATIHPSAGSVEVKLNGVTVLSATGINTRNSSNSYATEILFWQAYIDDLYVLDTTGSAPYNDFLGDIRVRTLYPSGAGSSTQWTPLSSTNVSNIDDQGTADSDTSYNSSDTAAQQDLFAVDNLPDTSGTVLAVQARWKARKDDGGTREVKTLVKAGGTTDSGPTEALGMSYVSYLGDILTENPDTAAEWAISEVNAVELGYELVS